jgi:hypothetical protein
MTKSVLALSIIALVSIPMAARASLITGVLNVTGTVNISLGDISFEGGAFNINAPASTQQGGFMALEGTTGTIDDITNPPDATGVALDETDFITFAAAPNISFTLTFLFPGIDGAGECTDPIPATGQMCTPNVPDQSPFNLQNTSATASAASFNILGTEVDTLTGDTIPVTGAFTEPFTAMTYQQLEADVFAGDTITTAFSAQFQTEALPSGTPEPSSLLELMMGIALVGISVVYRRKLKRT